MFPLAQEKYERKQAEITRRETWIRQLEQQRASAHIKAAGRIGKANTATSVALHRCDAAVARAQQKAARLDHAVREAQQRLKFALDALAAAQEHRDSVERGEATSRAVWAESKNQSAISNIDARLEEAHNLLRLDRAALVVLAKDLPDHVTAVINDITREQMSPARVAERQAQAIAYAKKNVRQAKSYAEQLAEIKAAEQGAE